MLYLELTQDGGDVGLVCKVGQNFQLARQKRKRRSYSRRQQKTKKLLFSVQPSTHLWVHLTHLEDLDLGGVCGSDVEAFQVWLKHSLQRERSRISSSSSSILGKSHGEFWIYRRTQKTSLQAIWAAPHHWFKGSLYSSSSSSSNVADIQSSGISRLPAQVNPLIKETGTHPALD